MRYDQHSSPHANCFSLLVCIHINPGIQRGDDDGGRGRGRGRGRGGRGYVLMRGDAMLCTDLI